MRNPLQPYAPLHMPGAGTVAAAFVVLITFAAALFGLVAIVYIVAKGGWLIGKLLWELAR